jgi:hypothetical protein
MNGVRWPDHVGAMDDHGSESYGGALSVDALPLTDWSQGGAVE